MLRYSDQKLAMMTRCRAPNGHQSSPAQTVVPSIHRMTRPQPVAQGKSPGRIRGNGPVSAGVTTPILTTPPAYLGAGGAGKLYVLPLVSVSCVTYDQGIGSGATWAPADP